LPEDEKTSKHRGGGRYNVILEFKGEQIKKLRERKRRKNEKKERKKKKMRKKERKKKKRRKRKKMSMSKNKNKVNSPVLCGALGISRLQD
jgi:hypothetical protein